jgi:hypothetical protein
MMKVKKKLVAIFTTLLMILSFVAVLPSPVHAQVAAVMCLDMAIKDPGTGIVTPGPFTPGGLPPMNLVLTNINNASRIGNVLIMAIMLKDLGTGISIDSYTIGFTYDPAVLKVTGSDPTTYGVYTVGTPLGLFPTVFEGAQSVTPGVVNTYAGYVANYTVSSTAGSVALGAGAAVYLGYITLVMSYWGKTNIDFTVTASPTQTTVSNLGTPHPLVDLDGYYEFSVHKVITSAGFDAYWGDPPAPYPSLVGENLTVTVSIKNTEAIHSWELNMSYNPAVFSLSAGPATVQEGPYFIVAFIDDTFSVTVDNAAGWLWANCTALPGQNRTGDGLLMAFLGWAVGYGISPFAVTSFNAVDSSGTTVSTDLELETGYFKFQKAPIVAMIDTGTGLPLMKSWTTPAHSIGETFQAAVSIVQTSEQVASWKAGFTFNPRVLRVDTINNTYYLGGNGVFTAGTIDNVNGIVSGFNGTDAAGDSGTGPGALMLVNFTVLDYGLSEMDMTDASVTHQTKLLDLAGQPIETPSGIVFLTPDYTEFEFRSPINVTVSISSNKKENYGVVGAAAETFTVQLNINSAENITGWQSGFWFDNTYMSCTGVVLGGYFGTGATNTTTISNTFGYVSISQSYQGDTYTQGAGLLATITFSFIDDGHSFLDLITTAGDPVQTVATDRDGVEVTFASLVESPWGHSAIVWFKPDVNGDGTCDGGDQIQVGNGLWFTPGYNPYADVNYDGAIDGGDQIVVGNSLWTSRTDWPVQLP